MSFIKPNAHIGVMAPSSFVERDDIEKSKSVMEDRGYTVTVHPQTFERLEQSAGTPVQKLEALHALYSDDSIDAIWAAGGGNRALYLLDDIDYDLIAQNEKPLIGFSDVTALLNPIYTHTQQVGFHAQVFKHLHDFDGLDDTLAVLSGEKTDLALTGSSVLQAGQVTGTLIGGCLSLFHYLPGTNDCPNLSGAILFLEDTGDEINRYDRMFAHMKRMGVFEQIGGLILGDFEGTKDTGRPFGFTLEDITKEVLEERDIPVLMNAPFGHGKNLTPFPVGGQATLDTGNLSLNLQL